MGNDAAEEYQNKIDELQSLVDNSNAAGRENVAVMAASAKDNESESSSSSGSDSGKSSDPKKDGAEKSAGKSVWQSVEKEREAHLLKGEICIYVLKDRGGVGFIIHEPWVQPSDEVSNIRQEVADEIGVEASQVVLKVHFHPEKPEIPWTATWQEFTADDANWGLNGWKQKMPSFWVDACVVDQMSTVKSSSESKSSEA